MSALDRSELKDVLRRCLEDGATDLHLESMPGGGRLRRRLDGVIHPWQNCSAETLAAWVAQGRAMAGLEGELRNPESGSGYLELEGRSCRFHLTAARFVEGPGAVLRFLDLPDSGGGRPDLDELVEDETLRDRIRGLARRSHGLFLVTGPTGCGKTTLLYALLSERDGDTEKILSVEDPVELPLAHVGQVAVDVSRGLTIPAALRSFLRSDPDVLMAGEIRDEETASILVAAALTGHQVFSCLHARDAVSALLRLADVGLEAYELGDAVTGILACRLLRTLCPHCKKDLHLTEEERRLLDPAGRLADAAVYEAVGCSRCRGGYAGRTGVFELLEISAELRRSLCDGPVWDELRSQAEADGMRPLEESAIDLLRRGLTSPAELRRVLSSIPAREVKA